MSETMLRFQFGAAWVFRMVAMGMLAFILFFVKSTYADFQEVKKDVQMQKEYQASQIELNKEFERRITKIETQ